MPCGPVLRIDEVFADPQVQHLGMTRTVDDPTRPRDRGAAPAAHLLRDAGDGPARPAAAGAHTREVLAELGYDDTEIDALLAAGAVATEARSR